MKDYFDKYIEEMTEYVHARETSRHIDNLMKSMDVDEKEACRLLKLKITDLKKMRKLLAETENVWACRKLFAESVWDI